LDVAKGAAALKFNFLPGINVPSQIAEGDTAAFQVPRRFVGSGTVTADSLEVRAFGRSFTLGTSSIDMERSTLDGVPLAGLVGLKAQVSGHHALVLECK
jgi:hypothetical protein